MHCAILKTLYDFKVARAHNTKIVNFSLKMLETGFLRSSKCSKTTWNLPEQPVELTQKLVTEITELHRW